MFKNSYNVPAFLTKLWDMVNDPSTDHLICWSPAGNSFIIHNQANFWYDLLPLYYKHNNMSSFVRQLNMYGFHKISTIENGTMDSEKDEIQFFHEYFKKDHRDLLKHIKRKQVTGPKIIASNGSPKTVLEPEDFNKVLSDVKQLRGRQASVDSQLSAMKEENTVLWRELAILRQKHIKQQQIVNKLIQFLVTIVQPTGRMSGLGVKRHFPLMINENPKKPKTSTTSTEGPTIHELDNDVLSESYLNDETAPEVSSPAVSTKSTGSNIKPDADTILDDSPDMVTEKDVNSLLAGELLLPNDDHENVEHTEEFETNEYAPVDTVNPKVFLNSWSQDKLLSNLISGSYNSMALNGKDKTIVKKDAEKTTNDTLDSKSGKSDMAVATRDNVPFNRLSSVEDLEIHLDASQNELDQLKEILNGCSSLDANALLGNAGGSAFKLFNDDTGIPYELSYSQNNDDTSKIDPLVSGSELATYGSNLLDFSQLFDDTSDQIEGNDVVPIDIAAVESAPMETPQIETEEPIFPLPE